MNSVPENASVGQVRLHFLPMPVRDVVTWRGSFRSQPDLPAGEEILQELVVALLDKGTTRRDRFSLAEFLEDRGARVSFRSDGIRVDLNGKSLHGDVNEVVGLMAEMMRQPLFDASEFEKARAKLAASLQRSLHNTGQRAAIGLSQSLYPASHPNYAFGLEGELERLGSLSLDDVRQFHKRHFVPTDADIVFAGDLDREAIETAVLANLGDWDGGVEPERGREVAEAGSPKEVHIPITDRDNLDVRLGHVVDMCRDHPDFMGLFVGVYALGGSFSARLMSQVRDELGLTYGIGASLVGVEPGNNGHFQISVTLSKDRLSEGIEATQTVVKEFLEEGVGEEELSRHQEAIAGSFKVRLSTTPGAASSLLHSLERGLGNDYLDRFPKEVMALDKRQVNRAIRKHLDPTMLCTVIAGTLADVSD